MKLVSVDTRAHMPSRKARPGNQKNLAPPAVAARQESWGLESLSESDRVAPSDEVSPRQIELECSFDDDSEGSAKPQDKPAESVEAPPPDLKTWGRNLASWGLQSLDEDEMLATSGALSPAPPTVSRPSHSFGQSSEAGAPVFPVPEDATLRQPLQGGISPREQAAEKAASAAEKAAAENAAAAAAAEKAAAEKATAEKAAATAAAERAAAERAAAAAEKAEKAATEKATAKEAAAEKAQRQRQKEEEALRELKTSVAVDAASASVGRCSRCGDFTTAGRMFGGDEVICFYCHSFPAAPTRAELRVTYQPSSWDKLRRSLEGRSEGEGCECENEVERAEAAPRGTRESG